MANVLYVDNDNNIVLNALQYWPDKTYVTDATISFTLYSDVARTSAVSGASALAMTLMAGTNGFYTCVVAGTVALVAGTKYYGRATPSGTYADKFEWEPDFIARNRK